MSTAIKKEQKTQTKTKKNSLAQKLSPANTNLIMRRNPRDVWESKEDRGIDNNAMTASQKQMAIIFGGAHFVMGLAIIGAIAFRTMGFDI